MLLYDCTHTAHCHANTGIQRVTRRLYRALAEQHVAIPVVFDAYQHDWRTTDDEENGLLRFETTLKPSSKRRAIWSSRRKLISLCAGFGIGPQRKPPLARFALLPETLDATRNTAALHRLKQRTTGPIVAIFHDLIPLQLPDQTPGDTITSFQNYLETLIHVDAVIAVSEASRDALARHWRETNRINTPRLFAINPGSDIPAIPPPLPTGTRTNILCVGSLEGRKNHVALLDAAETLWSQGFDFDLELIGLAHASTGKTAVDKIMHLKNKGRPITWHASVSDDALEDAYARCHFTVYPSLLEGFGLPVIESLARGRPCVCSGLNAMAETVRDGGCIQTGHPSPDNISEALRLLLARPEKLAELRLQINRRKFKTWQDYATELNTLIHQEFHILP